jgi:hypothetical protein
MEDCSLEKLLVLNANNRAAPIGKTRFMEIPFPVLF